MFGIKKDSGRSVHIPLFGKIVIEIVFSELNFWSNFPKGPNQLSRCLIKDIVISHLGKEVQGNIARELLKNNFQLFLNGLV